jgi:hypothetical protein
VILLKEGQGNLPGETQSWFVIMLETLTLPSRPYTSLLETAEAMKWPAKARRR